MASRNSQHYIEKGLHGPFDRESWHVSYNVDRWTITVNNSRHSREETSISSEGNITCWSFKIWNFIQKFREIFIPFQEGWNSESSGMSCNCFLSKKALIFANLYQKSNNLSLNSNMYKGSAKRGEDPRLGWIYIVNV